MYRKKSYQLTSLVTNGISVIAYAYLTVFQYNSPLQGKSRNSESAAQGDKIPKIARKRFRNSWKSQMIKVKIKMMTKTYLFKKLGITIG